jgi:hypothetical protein
VPRETETKKPPEITGDIRIARAHRRGSRARVRLGGMSSRLLTTMAIVRSNADKDRDYISNFEPFASDRLKSWPSGDPVAPDSLARAICDQWGVPSLPTAVGKILLRRSEQRGHIVRVGDEFFPNPDTLAELPDIAAQRSTMVARMNALAGAVIDYAHEVHDLRWSEQDATDALERLTEEFGADLALAKRRGGLNDIDLSENEALAVVHGFARSALQSNPMHFEYLEEMVQGTMLVNAVYFQDIGHVSNRLSVLRIYLDTTPILRALGLAADPVCEATRELLGLLRDDFNVPMFVFPHTLNEIAGVLDGVAAALRRGRQGIVAQGEGAGRNREAIDALVRKGCTAGEIEGMRAELEQRIRELGVGTQETPAHVEKGHIDEGRFEEILDDVVAYKSKGPLEKDLKSLAAVDRLRGATRPRDLSQANALFVTANSSLVRAARDFFGEADRGAPVPHAMHETALTAQLWVRAPHPLPDLPRKLLIADCYAALNPGPELWERWIQHIVRLQERGEVTEEQVQNLIYHQQARSKLFEVTHGDPDAVGDETVAEVLDRFEAELRRPAEEAAAAERLRRATVEAEAQQVRDERDDLRSDVASLSEWRKTQEETEKARRECLRRARVASGYLGSALTVLAFALFAIVLKDVHGKAGWASAITALVFLTTASWAWGTVRSWKLPFAALVFAGAATALFVNVFSIVPDTTHHTPPTRTK